MPSCHAPSPPPMSDVIKKEMAKMQCCSWHRWKMFLFDLWEDVILVNAEHISMQTPQPLSLNELIPSLSLIRHFLPPNNTPKIRYVCQPHPAARAPRRQKGPSGRVDDDTCPSRRTWDIACGQLLNGIEHHQCTPHPHPPKRSISGQGRCWDK
ncbi:hypothetical protein CDAR_487671 [Caerostris darwini]|uniref:Transposase n=1 Tax=Caerostris darwini TaxID=1538125 RepID=A0AAV4PU19_9ARAC|nr:hypothetical protein CDAR_487671 [Caerostris darwini]